MRHERWSLAWDVTEQRAVRIAPGAAGTLRPLCKAGRLVCPIDGCTTPQLNTVSGYSRGTTWVPDYFRHVAVADEGLHRGESAMHLLAKMHIQDWAISSGFEAVVERKVDHAHRRPDVTIVDPRSGRRLLVEVQFSPITVSDWRRRNDDLTAARDETMWLWGLVSPTSEVALTDAQRACVCAAGSIWFITADGESIEIAAGHTEHRHRLVTWRDSLLDDGLASLLWERTELLELTSGGIVDPLLQHAVDLERRRARSVLLHGIGSAWSEHVRAVEQAARRRSVADRQRRVEHSRSRSARRSPQRRPPVSTDAVPADSPWARLPAPPDRYRPLLRHEHWSDESVYRPPRVWKGLLVRTLIAPGSAFTLRDAVDAVRSDCAHDPDAVTRAVDVFLRAACAAGHLERTAPQTYRAT